MPPPAKCGARIEPWRARPVPFWRHGLAPPPETWPRVLVEAVPRRRAFSSARTVSCTTGMLNRASNALSSSGTVPELPSTGAERSGIAAHLHGAAARTRDRAPEQHQVPARDHLDHSEAALGHAPAAHPAGAAHPAEDPGGRGRGADRAGGADVVRAVRLGAALEVVALDRPLEALALGAPGHLHAIPRGEGLDGHAVADEQF